MGKTLNDRHDEWLGRRDAAAHLNMAVPTFDRLVRRGAVRKYHAAGLRTPLYRRSELDALVRPAEKT